MFKKKIRVSSGVSQLDRQLGGLFIGDNVVWYDDAGSLTSTFSLNFIQESQRRDKPLIYITFDRSPKTLLEDLGPLGRNQHLAILDCFTHGKGDGSEVFSRFYEKDGAQWPHQIVRINAPKDPEVVSEAFYSLHGTMTGDVRFVFDSLTGMQELWGGEEAVLKFYSHACPRLYELETIAYWIMEKKAHSERLRANINQIAQVAIDLSVNRGKSSLTILKAVKRRPDALNLPLVYWNDGLDVTFESETGKGGNIDLGGRVKQIRKRQTMSQKDLAALVGVTPSTISQIESGTIYPSLPALFKIAQVLGVPVAAFFQDRSVAAGQVVFSGGGTRIDLSDLPKRDVTGYRLVPADFDAYAEPYLIEISAGKKLPTHFFIHKGQEMGYLLEGRLELEVGSRFYAAGPGDVIYLTGELPAQWKNTGKAAARLLWVKIKSGPSSTQHPEKGVFA
ncbi:helix-turn-helix domain-containing protein [Desulfosarcina sp.]|uniref:helix-turn-helix domain-containing protein n=1 Tax=Desulfosarcina sp. TaxID=2027861 RepID=UPI003970DB21